MNCLSFEIKTSTVPEVLLKCKYEFLIFGDEGTQINFFQFNHQPKKEEGDLDLTRAVAH